MVQSLEQYVAQATQAYQPAQNAIQAQLDSLAGKLETANQQINKNYAQQQSTLNRNRNIAAETASMQAAGSGGSFGGAANIANRKYYEQTFVPAQTQLQTNQANELAQAKQNSENERTSLNSQIANLQSQAHQSALAQYYSDLAAEAEREFQRQEAEKQRQFQAQQAELSRQASARAAASSGSNAMGYINAIKNAMGTGANKQSVNFEQWLRNYSGYDANTTSAILGLLDQTGKASQSLPASIARATQNAMGKKLQRYYDAYNQWRNS